MARNTLMRFVMCGLLCGATAIGATEPTAAAAAPRDSEVAALRERVERQAAEIRRLEARVRALEADRPRGPLVVPPRATPPQVVPAPAVPGPTGDRVPPPGWVPREFNGMTYYLIPLQDGKGQAVVTAGPGLAGPVVAGPHGGAAAPAPPPP